MQCPRCGNQVRQDEAFCGQCGTPMQPAAQSTEMSAPVPRSGLLSSYGNNMPQTPHPYPQTPGTPPPHSPNSGGLLSGQIPPPNSSGTQQQTQFYHDATEAMTVLPSNTGYQTEYAPEGFSGRPGSGMPPNIQRQPAPTMPTPPQRNYSQAQYPPPSYPPQQPMGYSGVRGPIVPPRQTQSNTTVILVASIVVAVVLIAVLSFGAFALLSKHNDTAQNNQPSGVTGNTPVATTAPTEAPTPTVAPTPTADPTPTTAATPQPDNGFSWCGPICPSYGFTTEYPTTWQIGSTAGAAGVLFSNISQPNDFAAFKTLGASQGNADSLVTYDLQTSYASKPSYTAPTTRTTATISGETWITAVAYYNDSTQQKNRVQVYATIHQGKSYVIELNAPDSQFDALNTQFFQYMLARFQFSVPAA